MCDTCAADQVDVETVVGVTTTGTSILDRFGLAFPADTNWLLQAEYRVDTQTTPCTATGRQFTEADRETFGRTWWFWRVDVTVLEPIHDGNARRLATSWATGLLDSEFSTSPALADALNDVVFRATTARAFLNGTPALDT